jgi:hypothetical protein
MLEEYFESSSTLQRNERVKLAAMFWNIVGAGMLIGKEAVADDFVGTSLKRDKCGGEAGQGGAQDTGTHGNSPLLTGHECFVRLHGPPCITLSAEVPEAAC